MAHLCSLIKVFAAHVMFYISCRDFIEAFGPWLIKNVDVVKDICQLHIPSYTISHMCACANDVKMQKRKRTRIFMSCALGLLSWRLDVEISNCEQSEFSIIPRDKREYSLNIFIISSRNMFLWRNKENIWTSRLKNVSYLYLCINSSFSSLNSICTVCNPVRIFKTHHQIVVFICKEL